MRRAVLAFASLLLIAGASTASAQVFYQPVTYQWESPNRGGHYYYGGTNPHVHSHANSTSLVPGFGRTGGYAFQSGDYQVHREVVTEPLRLYTDALPYFPHAYSHGFRTHNAANEAYSNAATYFRKADLERNAILRPDGTWLVPSYTLPRGSIHIRPYVRPVDIQVEPVSIPQANKKVEPKPVLIIPKRLLDKPLFPKHVPMASAQQK